MLLLTGPSRLHRSFGDAIKKMRVYTFLFGIIEVFICRQLPPRVARFVLWFALVCFESTCG
jgi:hypothetical protein